MAELLAVKNSSSPPRTLTASPGFEVVLPDGAQLGGADAQGPNGQPISISPQQLAQKGHYSLPYALKPGETRFQVSYQLPYNGEATFSPTLLHTWNHLVLVLPPALRGNRRMRLLFQHMEEQQGAEGNVQMQATSSRARICRFTSPEPAVFQPRTQRNRARRNPAPRRRATAVQVADWGHPSTRPTRSPSTAG